MKKSIISIISIVSVLISSFSVSAAEVPRESAPCNAANEAIIFVESCIGDILTEVQNGLGYSDARAKSNRIFFDAFIKGQTNGYSYGELVDIANCAIWQFPDWYEESLLEHYEGTYFPNHMEKAGKASYVERNQEMINKSDFCVIYYDENYLPPRRKNSRRDLFDYQPKSGTAVAYDYAVKKKKKIINCF